MGHKYEECPICSGCLKVIDSRHSSVKEIGSLRRRRRKCLSCDYRKTTYEIGDDVLKDLLASKARTLLLGDLLSGGQEFSKLAKANNVSQGIKSIQRLTKQ